MGCCKHDSDSLVKSEKSIRTKFSIQFYLFKCVPNSVMPSSLRQSLAIKRLKLNLSPAEFEFQIVISDL